jgi:Leucine-rich repeat (LRR) protein
VHKQGFDDFTGTSNYDSALAFASKLTALEYLKLEGHASIAGLDNMHVERMHQRSLNVNHTDVDGKDLARLDKVLRQLYYLDVGNLRNVSKILKSLQGSKNLTWLGVENANLTNSDLTVIASMSNLRDLNLTGNSVVSDATLVKFANMRALQTIVLCGTNVTPACSKELAKYPSLEGVYLPARFRSFEKDIRSDLHDRRLTFQD